MAQWINFGGGQELWDELSGRFNIKSILCTNTGPQMGGWFKKEINTVDDFQGLRIRMPGMGGEILKRMGATPVTKSGGEIFLALSQGNIDAAEWIGPWNDLAFGFYKIAPYYYTSVFQEPGAAVAAGFNKDVWNDLSKSQQAIIKAVAADHYQQSVQEFNVRNHAALKTLVEKHKVQVRQFSPEIMAKLAEKAEIVVRETGQTDNISKRIYASYSDSLKVAKDWGGISTEPFFAARKLTDS